MFEKPAETAIPINALLARRWSGRAFDPSRPVPHEALIALCEAARWAPSCFGDEPWRYLVWDRDADPIAWGRAFATLSEGNRAWAGAAPLLVLAAASRVFSREGRPNRWGRYDTGAASMSLVLEATERGLMVHQMGGFDPERLRREFEIPETFECIAMMAIGYQLPEPAISEDLSEREHAPRSRQGLPERFFIGAWGRGLSADHR
jgi:nitroreductase